MACEGCTCGRAEAEATAHGEGVLRPNTGQRSFTAPAEYTGEPEGIEPVVPLRSKLWFNNPADVDMTSLHVERYVNAGLTLPEIHSPRKPIIGIAQTGSDLAPCNKHHLQLAERVRAGILTAGGTPFEFPCHPIQETGKRPNAALDRNLAYLSLVEVLHGYPIDGVVLLTGCDKTTPALLMGASTLNIPAIVMNVGPMLNGYDGDKLVGSGKVVWDSRNRLATGEIDEGEFLRRVALSAPSTGHCNTVGTATTMNALAEALGMALPGSASIPAVYRERGACAYATGMRIVDLVRQDIKPSDIMTREAFENAIAVCASLGGSTNAPIHLNAVAKHLGVPLDNDDWERVGYELPLLVNVQPAGEYLCEEFHRAGGVPSLVAELLEHSKLPHPDALTVSGKTIGENCRGELSPDRRVIVPFTKPLKDKAGFLNLKGNLFDSAIMKTSVISAYFSDHYLSDPADPMAFEGPVAVFDGPEDYHARIESESCAFIDEKTILVMRGAGPIGYPGAAEVVNMPPPARLLRKGIELPCIGDGRQSGTCSTPAILNASPEAASGGMLGYLVDGDVVRIDLKLRTANVKLSDDDIAARKKSMGTYVAGAPESQTPWQEMYRRSVGQLDGGMVLQDAVKYQRVAQRHPIGRRNH
ncbi:hypothetical protein Q5752_004383 [Cryptotrichosporon argae]